ncbi:glycosyltransferase family 4 protein, partial [Patescibacteria group bacterium]|nr:glycosyltransferase family 4 protein [Patescibacteria group bacterium]
EAVKILRDTYPGREIEWYVFGEALLPPDNKIASYKSTGFVQGKDLAKFYSSGDVMLCPAWYESFPLYPLEAMACGVPAVTTPYGTEDYAIDGSTALIVPAKKPQEMAKAMRRLIEEKGLANKLKANALAKTKEFTWEKSVTNLEKVLSVGSN